MIAGQKVSVSAQYSGYRVDHKTGLTHLIFEAVWVDGTFFRDHTWIRKSSRLKNLEIGKRYRFAAIVSCYLDAGDVTREKIGFRHIRSVVSK